MDALGVITTTIQEMTADLTRHLEWMDAIAEQDQIPPRQEVQLENAQTSATSTQRRNNLEEQPQNESKAGHTMKLRDRTRKKISEPSKTLSEEIHKPVKLATVSKAKSTQEVPKKTLCSVTNKNVRAKPVTKFRCVCAKVYESRESLFSHFRRCSKVRKRTSLKNGNESTENSKNVIRGRVNYALLCQAPGGVGCSCGKVRDHFCCWVLSSRVELEKR